MTGKITGPITAGSLNFAPPSHVTIPERIDWHLVSDHELDALSRPEGGVLGSIGFAGVGALLGSWPLAATAWSKIGTTAAIATEEGYAAVVFLLSGAAAIICLSLWGYMKRETQGLSRKIRARKAVLGTGEAQ